MKKIADYIKMSLFFMTLGAIVLYLAGVPLVSYTVSLGNMIMVKGAPGYPDEYNPELLELVNDSSSALEESEFRVPTLETQYGTIICDTVALTAPLYYGDSESSLSNGVGQYPLSGFPGKGKPILVSGHDVTFFAPLEKIEIGNVINITTNYGEYEYKVVATKIAGSADTTAYDLTQDKEQLILYTCYPFGQVIGDRKDRFFVYCDRIRDINEAVK
ncbi:MAG: class D sortase [Mobilitalea sp.]